MDDPVPPYTIALDYLVQPSETSNVWPTVGEVSLRRLCRQSGKLEERGREKAMRPSDVLPILGAVLVTISLTTRTASAETIYDGGRALGNGSARVYMEFEADGKLQALGVSFEDAMLEGLPCLVPSIYC